MKRRIKRITLIAFCFILCIAAVSCGKDAPQIPDNAVSVYNGHYLTTADYSYWLATAKYDYLLAMNDSIDSDEFWDSEYVDGKTHEEYFMEVVLDNIKYRTVALSLFDEYGLTLPDSVVLNIDADIEEKQEYVGSAAMSKELADINLNAEMLREVYINNAKYDLLYDFLYGSVGAELPTAEERAEYFTANYSAVKLIAVYTEAELVKDDGGAYIVDENDQYKFTELTEEEKAEKAAKVDEVLSKLEEGRSFEDCIKEYSEVDYSSYPNGLLYSNYDTERFGEDFLNKVKVLKDGEIITIKDGALTYIVKKYPLPVFEELTETDMKQISSIDDIIIDDKYKAKFDALIKNVEIKKDKMSSVSVRDISRNSYY